MQPNVNNVVVSILMCPIQWMSAISGMSSSDDHTLACCAGGRHMMSCANATFVPKARDEVK
eukprot:1142734-Pelagomonas_calceolata.AAC.6